MYRNLERNSKSSRSFRSVFLHSIRWNYNVPVYLIPSPPSSLDNRPSSSTYIKSVTMVSSWKSVSRRCVLPEKKSLIDAGKVLRSSAQGEWEIEKGKREGCKKKNEKERSSRLSSLARRIAFFKLLPSSWITLIATLSSCRVYLSLNYALYRAL